MKNLPYIFTVVFIIITALFAILRRFWEGFVYFVLGALLLLSVFWGVWLIYNYFTSFKKELDEKFKFFRVNVINQQGITTEAFDSALPAYRKLFKKKVLKDKLIKWGIILFCFACAGTFLVGMILY